MQPINKAIANTYGETLRRKQEARQRLEQRLDDLLELAHDVPACTTCEGRGVISYSVPVDHPHFGKLFSCPDCEQGAALEQRRVQNMLRGAAMPERYAEMTFGTFEVLLGDYNTSDLWPGKRLAYHAACVFALAEGHRVSFSEVYKRCGLRWEGADQVRVGLVFSGTYGIGKTGLMASIVNACIANGERPVYLRTAQFLERIQSRYGKLDGDGNPERPYPEDIKAIALDAPLLALDEFFIGRVGDVASTDKTRHIEDIFEYRKAHKKPTLITCNQTMEQVRIHWGPVVFERVFELCHYIPMAGEALRDTWQPTVEAF